MKKKVLFMTLAAAVVLTACGGKTETESADVETAVTEEADVETEGEEAEEADTADAQEAEPEEAVEAEEEETAEAAEEASSDYVKGTVTENGWESEWLGLRFTTPEGMTMSTDEELNEIMGLGEEVLSEDFSELQLEYAKMSSVYEMMSADEPGLTNVMVTAEKMLVSSMDAEAYADAVRQGLESVSQIDYTISEENENVTIGGTDFVKVSAAADYSGVSMYKDYYIGIIGDRAVSIAVTYVDDTADLANQVVNAFEAY